MHAIHVLWGGLLKGAPPLPQQHVSFILFIWIIQSCLLTLIGGRFQVCWVTASSCTHHRLANSHRWESQLLKETQRRFENGHELCYFVFRGLQLTCPCTSSINDLKTNRGKQCVISTWWTCRRWSQRINTLMNLGHGGRAEVQLGENNVCWSKWGWKLWKSPQDKTDTGSHSHVLTFLQFPTLSTETPTHPADETAASLSNQWTDSCSYNRTPMTHHCPASTCSLERA